MFKHRLAGGIAILAAASMVLAGVQEYKLRFTPKAGEVYKYKMSGEMSVMGMTVGMTATMVNKTTKVESNGNYVIESAMQGMKINMNGSEQDVPDQGGSTTVFRADGAVLSVQGEGAEEGGRMANLMAFIGPEKGVKVGDSWTIETKGDSKKSTVDVSGTYKLEAIEKIGDIETAKVSYKIEEKGIETPATVSGTAWVDVRNGNAIKVESVWKAVPIPGAGPVDGKMTMTYVP